MQWVARGEVRLPVRYIYLAVIVLLSAYFLAREISNVGSRRRQNGCTGLREDLLHQKSPPVRGDQQDQHDQQAMQNEIHGRSERVCWRKPTQTTYCPHCFQPAAYRLSKKLQPVSHSSLSFPRGPPFLFQPRNTRQQRSVDDYLITPWAVCRPHWRCPYLLAIQLSIAGDVERRLAVRSTWGSVAKTQTWPHTLINGGVQLLFVLARPAATIKARSGSSPWSKLSPEQQWAALQHEASTHGDLLYLNMQDSYFNLTLKLISAFQWVREHCTTIKFVLKVDSDTFVNVPLLLDLLMLNEKRLKYSVLGTIYTHDRTVHRSGKWAVNDSQYPPPVYPVYASGCNYALSSAALAQITEIAPYFAGNHVSTFLGADYFVTGILGVPLALEFFDVMDHQVFGQCNKTSWHVCDMVSANRVFGYVGPSRGKATSLAYIWRAFYRFYGH